MRELSVVMLVFLFNFQAFSQIKTSEVSVEATNDLTTIDVPAKNGGENILRLSVSDAPSDYLSFANWTGSNQIFIPSIRGYRATDNRMALVMGAFIESNQDNGTDPVMLFDSRRTTGGVSTRPLFGWSSSGSRKMTLTADGKLGIGTETPAGMLHVETPGVSGGERLMRLTVADAPDDYLQFNNATGSNNQLIPVVKGYHTSDNRPALFVSGEVAPGNDTGNDAVVVFDARVTGGPITTRPVFAWKSHTLTRMTMLANGNVGIARSNPNHRLDVNGNINASEYYNSGNLVNWPDYVFEDTYELSSLEEVEKHIKKHGHLENIPSEKEVAEHGYRMGDMDTKLLEKVEELTLYLIDMNKKLEAQNERIEALEKENKKLKNRKKS